MLQSIAAGEDDQNGDRQGGKILLVLHTFVGRQHYIELARCQRQQLSILDACPTTALNADSDVTDKQRPEAAGN